MSCLRLIAAQLTEGSLCHACKLPLSCCTVHVTLWPRARHPHSIEGGPVTTQRARLQTSCLCRIFMPPLRQPWLSQLT